MSLPWLTFGRRASVSRLETGDAGSVAEKPTLVSRPVDQTPLNHFPADLGSLFPPSHQHDQPAQSTNLHQPTSEQPQHDIPHCHEVSSMGIEYESVLGTEHLEDDLENPKLPPYIKPLPKKLQKDDIQYLARKGCLLVPNTEICHACLSAYVEFVHPQLPLMNLNDFLLAVSCRVAEVGNVSLLLFHALLFATISFVDLDLIKRAGFPDRRAARMVFFNKAKVGFISFAMQGS